MATYTDPVAKSWVMDSYEDFAEGTTNGTDLGDANIVMENFRGIIFNLKLALALAASLAAGALCFASTAAELVTSGEPATFVEPAPAGPAPNSPFTAPRYFNPYTPRQDNPTNPPGTWEVYPSPTTKHLQALDFVDANNGWAVGGSVMLRYRNGVWSEEGGHAGRGYDDIDMVSTKDGWAVGWDGNKLQPAIWRWDGNNWNEFQNPSGAVYCIDMIDASHGWIGGKNYFLRFNGTTWEWGGGAPDTMLDIDMNSDTDGRAVGDRYIMRRIGNNWVQETASGNWNLGRLFMLDGNFGWAVGQWRPTEKVMILKYEGSWTVNKIFSDYWGGYSVWALRRNSAWTCCASNYSPPWGAAFFYYDGSEWLKIRNPDPGENIMADLYFFDDKNGWGVGSGGKIWRYKPNSGVTNSSLGIIKAKYR